MTVGQSLFAQTPHAIKYQAVVRDTNAVLLTNQAVSLRVSIRSGSAAGTIVFQETHSETSNSVGLISLAIGTGTPVSGSLAGIDWGTTTFFMQIEMDS